MAQPKETDGLLPKNESAPEISRFGSLPGTVDVQGTVNLLGNEAEMEQRPPLSTQSNQEAGPTTAVEQSGNENEKVFDPDKHLGSLFSTRSIIYYVTAALFFGFWALFAVSYMRVRPSPSLPSGGSLDQRVRHILQETPLIDGHNDLAIVIRAIYKNQIHSDEFRSKFEDGGLIFDVDLPRLESGLVGGTFWSAYVTCPENASKDFSDQEYASSVAQTLSQIDLIHRLQAQYPTKFTPATASLSDALDRFHQSRSIISPISIEGLHQLPQSAPLSTLRLYHTLGVRAATLTWNCHNRFADAALITSGGKTTVAPYHRGGLTDAGRRVIREMNRLGILVDISHTSYWAQKAVLSNRTSLAPVIFTHSSAFSLCPHPRNVQDDILDLVRETNSLVMVNFNPDFISCRAPEEEEEEEYSSNPLRLPDFYPENNTLHQVARHIMYIGERIGYDHVGLGSDFDGIGFRTPAGLDGVDKFPRLIRELLRLGVDDSDAAKVAGGNLLRVWRKADHVSRRLRQEENEGEDEIDDDESHI